MRRHSRAAILGALVLAGALAAQGEPPKGSPEVKQPSLYERAIGAERHADFKTAAKLYAELTRREPQEVRWFLAAGRCLGRLGRFNDGLDLLDDARKRFPDVLEVPSLMARTYMLKAESMLARGIRDSNLSFHFEEAARVAESILRRDPGAREARLILAKCNFNLGKMDEALAQAEEAARRFPDHQGGYVLLGDIAYRRFLQRRKALTREKHEPHAQADLIALAAAERKRALAAYERALAIDPSRAYPQVKIGNIHAWNANLGKALVHYRAALALDPGCAVNHGWITAHVKLDERIRLYRDAAAAYRRRPDAKRKKAAILDWYQAYALLEKKRYKAARELFVRAVQNNESFANSHYYAMLAAYWEGEEDIAEKQAVEYARKAPRGFADLVRGLPEPDETLGILEFLTQRTYKKGALEASRELNRVLAMVRDTAAHWNNYAFLCRETGQYEESFAAYQHALEVEPNSPQLLNDAGVVLQYHLTTKENLQKARGYYRRALKQVEVVLHDPHASEDDKARARQARQDANSNLKKLAKASK